MICYSCYHFLLFFLVTQALKFRVAGSIHLFLLKGNYYAFNYASRALYGWTRMLLDSYVLLFAFLQNLLKQFQLTRKPQSVCEYYNISR